VKIDTAWVGHALRVKVDIMPVDTAQKTIYDIKQPLQTPLVVEEFAGYVGLGVLALAVLASAIYLIVTRTRKAKGKVQEEEAPKEAPHIVAIRNLEILSHQKMWQNGKHKAYWSRLSEILREYLDGRYGVGAMEMTTDEIVDALREVEIGHKQKMDLLSVLRDADLVKFAKATPEANDNELAYDRAYHFVEETKPVEVVEEEEDEPTKNEKEGKQ
jgi:hypothetical protein